MNPSTSPFKFLDSYQREDADIFFGREGETDALYEALSGVKHLLVYGPSGAGKTSLIECGLRNQFSDADWFALSIRRGSNMTASVFSRINTALRRKIALDPQTHLPLDPEIDFGEAIENLFDERYRPVYLLFDQFEELLISGSDNEKRDFFTRLDTLIRYKVPCRVLLVMREEFIGHLSEFEPLCPSIFQHRFRLEKMGRSNVQAVIQQILQAEKYRPDFRVEQPETLAKNILAKLPDTQREIELAHVQVFLGELWDRATASQPPKGGVLPVLHSGLVQENDNLERVLDSFLKKQLEQLEQRHGEKVSMELLAAMISERHTKLQMSAGALEKALAANAVSLVFPVADLLRDLEQRRIVRTLKSGEETQFEISHDVLALVVGQNLTNEMKLREKAREVYRVYEGRAGLFSREDLDYLRGFEGFLGYSEELGRRILESETHILAAQKEELAKTRKRFRTVRGLLVAAVAGVLVAGFVGLWAWEKKKEADISRNKTIKALEDLAKKKEDLRQTFQIVQTEKNRADTALIKSLVATYNQFAAEGKSAMESSEYEQAIRNFTSALSAIHEQPKVIFDNGQSCRELLSICQQKLPLKTSFEEAIQSGDAFMEKGVIYVLEAIDEYQKAIQIGYNNSFAESKLAKANGEKKAAFLVFKDKGVAFANAGRCDYAVYFLNKALKIFQDNEVENKLKFCIEK